jgi:large subunit ribosomal protein L4
MAGILAALVGKDSALVLMPEQDKNIEKSVRNLPNAWYLRASYLNIRDLFTFDKIVMPLGALEVIEAFLG